MPRRPRDPTRKSKRLGNFTPAGWFGLLTLLWSLPGWPLNYDVWAYRWIPAAVRWGADSLMAPILLALLGTVLITAHLTLTATRGGEPYRGVLKSLAAKRRSWLRRRRTRAYERLGVPVKCEIFRSDGNLLKERSARIKPNQARYFQVPHAPSREGQSEHWPACANDDLDFRFTMPPGFMLHASTVLMLPGTGEKPFPDAVASGGGPHVDPDGTVIQSVRIKPSTPAKVGQIKVVPRRLQGD